MTSLISSIISSQLSSCDIASSVIESMSALQKSCIDKIKLNNVNKTILIIMDKELNFDKTNTKKIDKKWYKNVKNSLKNHIPDYKSHNYNYIIAIQESDEEDEDEDEHEDRLNRSQTKCYKKIKRELREHIINTTSVDYIKYIDYDDLCIAINNYVVTFDYCIISDNVYNITTAKVLEQNLTDTALSYKILNIQDNDKIIKSTVSPDSITYQVLNLFNVLNTLSMTNAAKYNSSEQTVSSGTGTSTKSYTNNTLQITMDENLSAHLKILTSALTKNSMNINVIIQQMDKDGAFLSELNFINQLSQMPSLQTNLTNLKRQLLAMQTATP